MNADTVQVVIIDDEISIREEVAQILGDEGYRCHTFECADAARLGIPNLQPDVIVSDINLDGESGLELCRNIRNSFGLNQIPVIFISGAEIPNIIRRSHAAGGTYYLRKPLDPNVLIDLVEKALWMPHLVGART